MNEHLQILKGAAARERGIAACYPAGSPMHTDSLRNAEAYEAAVKAIAALGQGEAVQLDAYDAGLLNDHGGGDVGWWQDYIRAELDRAHDFYQSQLYTHAPQPVVADDWQQRCLDLGFKYWRAPDAHGVECTHDQALALLRDLLGVEVDFAAAPTPEAQPSLTEQNADVLAIQLAEVRRDPHDSYMRGLYNGMLMICCTADGTDYQPEKKPGAQPQGEGRPSAEWYRRKIMQGDDSTDAFAGPMPTFFLCSNPSRRHRHESDPQGHCPACIREGLGNWSCVPEPPKASEAGQGVDGLAEVLDEIARATKKFPLWPTDPIHALAVLGEEYGELNKAVLQHTYEPHKSTRDDIRTEAIQTAAMALRFVASLGAYIYQGCMQHNQKAIATHTQEGRE